jgi:hypothetical protein
LASRLIRIKDPRTLRDFLGDPNLFQILEGVDFFPVGISQESSHYPISNLTQRTNPLVDNFPGDVKGPPYHHGSLAQSQPKYKEGG